MKKSKIMTTVAVGIVAVVATANVVTICQQEKELKEWTSLAFMKVESLADNESGGGGNYEFPDGQSYMFECGVKVGVFQFCRATVITCQSGGDGCNSRKCPQHG